MSFFSSRRVGELNSRISADISLLQDTFTTTLAQFVRQVITIVGGITLLTIISPRLTVFMLALIPVVAIVARIFGTFIRKLSKKAQTIVAESNTIVEETLQAIASVKAFANEAYEIFRYKKKTDEVIEVSLKSARWRGLFVSFIMFALFGSIIGVVWYGVYLINQGAGLSTGDLLKFVLYSVFIGGSISGVADLYSDIQRSIGATENLLDILDETTEPLSLKESDKSEGFYRGCKFPESFLLLSFTERCNGPEGHFLSCKKRRTGSACRAVRGRKKHHQRIIAAILRSRRRKYPDRREGCQGLRSDGTSRQYGDRAAGGIAVWWYHQGKY